MDIEQLVALEAIRSVKARYCRFVDEKQWSDLRQLFAPEVQLTFRGVDGQVLYQFENHDAFVDLTSSLLNNAQTIHQVHNSEITLTSPTTAIAIWSMEDRIICPPDQEGPFKTLHGFGHYHDTFEFFDKAWRIKSIDLSRTILNIT